MVFHSGGTPLYVATSLGHFGVVNELLSCRVDVNKANLFSGETPVYVACKNSAENKEARQIAMSLIMVHYT